MRSRKPPVHPHPAQMARVVVDTEVEEVIPIHERIVVRGAAGRCGLLRGVGFFSQGLLRGNLLQLGQSPVWRRERPLETQRSPTTHCCVRLATCSYFPSAIVRLRPSGPQSQVGLDEPICGFQNRTPCPRVEIIPDFAPREKLYLSRSYRAQGKQQCCRSVLAEARQ